VPTNYDRRSRSDRAVHVQVLHAGQQSVFVKNPNYWEDGADGKPLPYLDEWSSPTTATRRAR